MGAAAVTCSAASVDLKVGGRYRIQLSSDGGDHTAVGEYREIVPNEKLRFTWSWENGTVTDTMVTVGFKEMDGGTELTLVHENFVMPEAPGMHAQGWNGSLDKLVEYVS